MASSSSQKYGAYPVVPGLSKYGILPQDEAAGWWPWRDIRWPGLDRLRNSRKRFPTRRVAQHSCSNDAGRRLRLPSMWRRAQEPGPHVRMSRLRPSDFDHGRQRDASLQAPADGLVLGRTSDVDALKRVVGAAVGGSTRPHLINSASPTRPPG